MDSPARAAMQGFHQYNGYYWCSWCLHPGKPVKHIVRSTIKYPLQAEVIEKRTEIDTIHLMEQVINQDRTICGVRGGIPLLDLNKFNIIDGFVPDEMHCVALGVVKQFTLYWLNTSRKPYSLSIDDKNKIDDFIKSFKVPNQLCRLTRSLKNIKYWKAKEWENWLLYYSLPALKTISSFQKYSDYWELLVQAIYILMKDSITIEEVITAHDLLKDFVYHW